MRKYGKLMVFSHILCGANLAWIWYRKERISILQGISLLVIALSDLLVISSVLARHCEKKQLYKK